MLSHMAVCCWRRETRRRSSRPLSACATAMRVRRACARACVCMHQHSVCMRPCVVVLHDLHDAESWGALSLSCHAGLSSAHQEGEEHLPQLPSTISMRKSSVSGRVRSAAACTAGRCLLCACVSPAAAAAWRRGASRCMHALHQQVPSMSMLPACLPGGVGNDGDAAGPRAGAGGRG